MNKEKLIESIKQHEGYSAAPYMCPAGKLTIGYGRNLEENGISNEEAEQLLENDINKIYDLLTYCIKYDDDLDFNFFLLPKHVQNVLIEMSYQMGVNGLLKFKKTLKLIEQREYEKASIEMLNSRWAKQTPQRAKKLSNLMKGGF